MNVRRRRVERVESVISREEIFSGLNPEQRQVVEANEGAFLVVATAGSGKTRAVVHRVARLVADGVNESTILCTTFSKKAAEEMNARLRSLGVTGCRVGTWHSVAWEILRTERPELEEWEVDATDRYRVILKNILGWDGGNGMQWKSCDLSLVSSYIGICKASIAFAGSDRAHDIADQIHRRNPCEQTEPALLFEAYERADLAARQRRLVTFDDQLLWTWQLLTEDQSARDRWAGKFRYLIQDEAQDANLVQCELAELLARPPHGAGNYMIVGDPAQSIYGFRGACPEKLLAFETEWNATRIAMARNYRSGSEVIELANGSIRAMPPESHLGVEMIAERGSSAAVELSEWADLDEEGEQVARRVMTLHEDGSEWKSFAVLYRTNAQSRGVEEAMLRHRIPYVVLGGANFYDRREIKDLLAYLRVAEGRGEFDALRRCINTPFRFLGKAFVERIDGERTAEETWIDTVRRVATSRTGLQGRQRTAALEFCGIVEAARSAMDRRDELESKIGIDAVAGDEAKAGMPAAILERIITSTSYLQHIVKDEGAESVENNRISNIRELIRASERFTTVRDLLDYVDRTLEQARKAASDPSANRVILCSIHRSKGLEWPHVHVIGCNEMILPHARAETDHEERRLFYVATTRARDGLFMSYVRQAAVGARIIYLEPSRFLAECGIATKTADPEVASA